MQAAHEVKNEAQNGRNTMVVISNKHDHGEARKSDRATGHRCRQRNLSLALAGIV